jgi:hypothetical protein
VVIFSGGGGRQWGGKGWVSLGLSVAAVFPGAKGTVPIVVSHKELPLIFHSCSIAEVRGKGDWRCAQPQRGCPTKPRVGEQSEPTLGNATTHTPTPTGLPNECRWLPPETSLGNPFRVVMYSLVIPRVGARSSHQPWASLGNPVGVPECISEHLKVAHLQFSYLRDTTLEDLERGIFLRGQSLNGGKVELCSEHRFGVVVKKHLTVHGARSAMASNRDSFIFVLDKYGLLVEKGSVLGELFRKVQVIYWMPKNVDAANGGFP